MLVFFDDILIYSRTWNSHLEHVKIVMQVLESISLLSTKYKFGCIVVNYLGHIICENGIAVDVRSWRQLLNGHNLLT